MDNKRGFTLIELLIVVVIIGILAAIAIPRFGETRERAFRSSMTSDLRNIQTLQEQYYFDESRYAYLTTGTINDEDVNAELGFQASSGVTILLGAATDGYTATASHEATGTGRTCVLTVSSAGSSEIDCSAFDGGTPAAAPD